MEEIINSPEYKLLEPYLFVISLAFLGFLILLIVVCWQLRSSLIKIKAENRCIHPEQVWLLLLPFFNIYWNFVVARKFSDSLNNEFFDKKVAVEENPAFKNGNIFAWSFLALNFPLPGFVFFIIFILCSISLLLYSLKIREYNRLLEQDYTDFD